MHKKKKIGDKQIYPKYSEEIEQSHHFKKSNNNESPKNNIVLQTVQKYRSVCFTNKRSKILNTPPSTDFNIELKNKHIHTVYDALSLNIIKNIQIKKSQKDKIKNTHFQYLQKVYNFYKISNKLLDHQQLSTACKDEPIESVHNNRDFDQTMSNMPTSILSVCSPNIFLMSPISGKLPEINISQQNYDIKNDKQFSLSEHKSFSKEKVLKYEFQFKNSYLNYLENQFAILKDYSMVPNSLLGPDAVKLKNAELLKIGGKINISNNENEPSTSTKPCVQVWCCDLSRTKTLNSQISKTIETKITPCETSTFSKTNSEIIEKEEDYSRIEGTKKIISQTLTYPESEMRITPYHIKTNSRRAITQYTHFPSETKNTSLGEIYLHKTEMEETSYLSELSSEVADTEDIPSLPVTYYKNIILDRPLLPRTYSRKAVKNISNIPKIYPENNIKQKMLLLKYLEKIEIDYPKSITKMYLTENDSSKKKVNFMKNLKLIITKKKKKMKK